jgi:hypothetical protein
MVAELDLQPGLQRLGPNAVTVRPRRSARPLQPEPGPPARGTIPAWPARQVQGRARTNDPSVVRLTDVHGHARPQRPDRSPVLDRQRPLRVRWLRLSHDWPWAIQLATTFDRLDHVRLRV